MQNRKLVYWGIGTIGKRCIEYFPEKRPQFIIDSNCVDKEYRGIPIYRSEDIAVWDDIYVVITVMDSDPIKEMLVRKNLKENKDFQDYRNYFNIYSEKAEDNIVRLRNYVYANNDLENRTLIVGPLFTARQSNTLINFLRSYSKRTKCLLLNWQWMMSEHAASEKLGFPMFKTIEMLDWGSYDEAQSQIEKYKITDLSFEELAWIEELSYRKNKRDSVTKKPYMQQYQYIKDLVKIFRPRNVIIWGCWASESYMLGHICGEAHIPCGYMEYGWLPGTYQFDPKGIAGQGECANEPNPEIDVDSVQINKIKNYIISKKLDTGSLLFNSAEESILEAIDSNKKTIFLVGMGDDGMQINPESDYWKTYVSSTVSSTQEAYEWIGKICEENDWNFLFKPHPGVKEVFDNKANAFIVHDIQIDRLIEKADVVVSISSAVNYKVLLYNKPLVQIGITCLSGKDCCYEVYSKEQIEDNIINALSYGMTEEQRNNFDIHLSVLLDNYLWDDLSERCIRYGLGLEKDFQFK